MGYRVHYRVVGPSEGDTDDEEAMEEPIIPATEEQVLLQRLEKWTQYFITVSASTVIGPGPESEPLMCRTDEDGTLFILFFLRSKIKHRNKIIACWSDGE